MDARELDALEELLAIAELYVPVPLEAPGFRRARAAIASAKAALEAA